MPPPIFAARDAPAGILAAVSERGATPSGTPSPTAFLARDFVRELGYPDLPLVRATQVHGGRVVTIEERPAPGETADAGECDALVTRLGGVGLVVQTADCVPVLLAASDAIGAVHAGWRGAAANVAGTAAEAFRRSTEDPESVRAWLGPSIGACCYEVGGEVAAQFSGDFLRASCDGRYRLDLPSIVRAQLEAAGIPNVASGAPCTMCGGERYASYRRDREKAGRMIALIARMTRSG
jgi:YfiH family protein